MDSASPQTPLTTENTAHSGSGEKNAGSIIGIIIIVLVLALGGLYFWGKRVAEKKSAQESPDTNLLVPAPDSSAEENLESGI